MRLLLHPRRAVPIEDRFTPRTPDLKIKLDHLLRASHRGVDIAIALTHDRGFGAVAGGKFDRLPIRVEQHRHLLNLDRHKVSGIFRDVWMGAPSDGDHLFRLKTTSDSN